MSQSLVSPSCTIREVDEPSWYALYTCARHEKQVALQLAGRNVEHFLPLYSSTRSWKDRRVQLQMPLFPGYVFVRIPIRQRLSALQVLGAVSFVTANGHPVTVADEEIAEIWRAVNSTAKVEPYPYLKVGQRVRVCSGPLVGLEGILTRKKSFLRVVISLELIQRAIAVEVDAAEIEPIAALRRAA
jgi:transcription antitermination factor NusG